MNDLTFDLGDGISAAYLIAAAFFMFGLHLLNSPATARRGNAFAALGMLVAIIATLVNEEVLNYGLIAIGVVVGSIIGAFLARTIQMTAMPQMVAVFNGFGGGASGIIAASEFLRIYDAPEGIPVVTSITIALSVLIGVVTFSGSFIAFGKLQGLVSTRPVLFPLQKILNLVLFIGIVAAGIFLVATPDLNVFILLAVACLLLGVLLVIPIGGADMPVVISLLNSYSGLAAAAAGFALGNAILIVAGSLVGAAGFILTRIMTRAMNRSLVNVMFGGVGASAGGSTATGGPEGRPPAREVAAEDAAVGLAYAQNVIFVPGYGLAVAQAQHQMKQLANQLESRGVNVKYAIHPVAGRMPGHMNVLLAEADVPYDKLFDLDQVNPDFDRADVAVVVGANDVVNPAARETVGSPIYGMPILNVDHARSVLFLKRSMSPGFAGVDNELFYKENTMMLFGDAKDSLNKLIQAVSEEE